MARTGGGRHLYNKSRPPGFGFQLKEYKNYPGPIEGLSSKGKAWTGFFRQEGREIIVDLGETRPIKEVSLVFQQNAKAGVQMPKYLSLSISNDQKKWSYLGKAFHAITPSDETVQEQKLGLTFAPVVTRYVKLNFPVAVWVFAKNLSIIGGNPGEFPAQPATFAHGNENGSSSYEYLKVPDMNDVLLIYSGGNGEQGTWKKEDFLPLISYQDGQGQLKGKMFDTMLFLPYGEVGSTKQGWQKYLNDLFAPGKQLAALNEAVAQKNQNPALVGKEKVILTLPYPDPAQRAFGTTTEDTISFSALDGGREAAFNNRLAALTSYYGQLMDKWKGAQFKNLDLAGIYWYRELVEEKVPDEKKLIQHAAAMVHKDGGKFVWIPYFGTEGYKNWQEYGFDYVFVQPSYYANEEQPVERMDSVAQLARQQRVGVELEFDDKMLYNRYYYDLFYKELNKAHELGFDGPATNAYYMGGKSLLNAFRSDIPQARKIYDDMYRWINGMYEPDTGK
ncbi:DUF4855 domain-containing protein [Aneurinibacillus tyrosinisolvens]|uniref:DUF4855 domain-containing protein n=1 Tax=Aneurinibacillus tyrosinisolvens TaxID=1443435 RepID=UPI00069B197C|nr:DUF4855 domain-containing protein [Aneurinibacillus tyrosinisolvens]